MTPQVEGFAQLNDQLSDFTSEQVDEYRQSHTGEAGYVSVTWSTLGSSDTLVGFLLSSELNPGASTGTAQRTVWYDTERDLALRANDLVTAEGWNDVITQVTSTLRAHVTDPDLAEARRLLASGEVSIGFDDEGMLLIGYDAYQVAAGSYGAVFIRIDDPSDELLSEVGRAARAATLQPRRLAPPEPDPPAPQPVVDCEANRCVALTFDDGPGGGTTAQLLDILQREQVSATFFVLGSQVQAHPQLLERAAREGHEIGSHSWSHPQLTSLSEDAVRAEVQRTDDAIAAITGAPPVLFRPPYGARDETVDAILAETGHAQALWSVDTLDWKTRDPAATVAAAAKAKPGAIVLMHDIHDTTVAAVPDVIRVLREKGFTFVTVSQLVSDPQPGERYYGTY